MTTGLKLFTPQVVGKIRAEWDAGTINVRAWADEFQCSPETIRKVGRRDTYRHVGAGQGSGASTPSVGATFPKGTPEPTEAELAASIERLTRLQSKAESQEGLAGDMLDELTGGQNG